MATLPCSNSGMRSLRLRSFSHALRPAAPSPATAGGRDSHELMWAWYVDDEAWSRTAESWWILRLRAREGGSGERGSGEG